LSIFGVATFESPEPDHVRPARRGGLVLLRLRSGQGRGGERRCEELAAVHVQQSITAWGAAAL